MTDSLLETKEVKELLMKVSGLDHDSGDLRLKRIVHRERWPRFMGQFGGWDKVDCKLRYAANLASSLRAGSAGFIDPA